MIQLDVEDNTYHKFLLDKSDISYFDTQRLGSVTSKDTIISDWGTAKFSPYGKKWAWYTVAYGLHFFDFDRSTGHLSIFKRLKIPHKSALGGVEFSPNSRFVYLT